MWVTQHQLDELKKHTNELIDKMEEMKNRPYLIGIERSNGVNKFTFFRKDKVIEVQTKSLIGDNLPEWKKQLLR